MKKRAMKKHIPYGEYCHGIIHETIKDGELLYECDVCPWWYHRVRKITVADNEVYDINKYGCKYLGIEQDECDMLWDQVKECGEHYD